MEKFLFGADANKKAANMLLRFIAGLCALVFGTLPGW
jgi:hypothetical protein